MSDMVGSIRLEHFRGLPNSLFELGGKNLMVLGSNGKGKSGFVDGIEFAFAGQIGRFVGSGTGSINHDDAVQHIRRGGTPKITLQLSPSRAEITRSLGGEAAAFCARPNGAAYFQPHPSVSSFVLRRAAILDFINDHAADRYKKFVQLLGIAEVDAIQSAFLNAEKESATSAKAKAESYKQQLRAFDDPAANFSPKNLRGCLKNDFGVI